MWEEGSAALDVLREAVGPRPPLGAQLGAEAQLTLFLFLRGLTMGQGWRNKENKDQVILQAAWLAKGGCSAVTLACPAPHPQQHTQQSGFKWHCATHSHRTNCRQDH